ncbi:MAG TPA: hypothetical protein PLO23_00130 [Alphaproteobacteria bacterium]|nr:hypothetical protein [Alphaproteobacteria bacterium]
MTHHPEITDYNLQALIDNELTAEQAERVLALISTDPRAKNRYIELCRQKDFLKIWWAEKQRTGLQ